MRGNSGHLIDFVLGVGNPRTYWLSSGSIVSPASPISTPSNQIPRLMDTIDTMLNRRPKLLCRQTPTQSSYPCPETEL